MPINTLNHPVRVTTFRLPEKKGRVISQNTLKHALQSIAKHSVWFFSRCKAPIDIFFVEILYSFYRKKYNTTNTNELKVKRWDFLDYLGRCLSYLLFGASVRFSSIPIPLLNLMRSQLNSIFYLILTINMLRAHRKFSILGIWTKTKILKDGRRRKNEHNEMPYKTLSKFYLWLF